jgi:hypothetical protein
MSREAKFNWEEACSIVLRRRVSSSARSSAGEKTYNESTRQSRRAEKEVCCIKSGRHTARICEP